MNSKMKEMIKFVLTGGVCFLIEYAALVILKEWLHLPVVAATPIAFLISVVFNYLLCVKWVFEGAKEGSRAAQLGFVITSVMGLFLNWLIMWALTALLGEDTLLFTLLGIEVKVYMLNKVIATALVMVWNYFTKRYVLRRGESK
ncbi:MAG: GtrA family protein [Clostridia bacterium]|nr:GtrA family protein [Clostridia bacterium]MBQ7137764.1 GtrA family protein [Clostridia bacterium]